MDSIGRILEDVSREARRLHVVHEARLRCKEGCSSCCVDDLSTFAVESDVIRARYPEVLASGIPHAIGACAFLDDHGACRIYEARPYVCRTQGLPLRWIEEREPEERDVELRDICPLNDVEGDRPLEELSEGDCWTLGPTEERLARLQLSERDPSKRSRLRDLFGQPARGRP